jgi:Poxvirus Late Transcription Factor VLTF3 like
MPKRKTTTMKPVKSKTVNLSLDKRYTKELNELYNKQYSIKDKKKEIVSIQKKIDQMRGDPVKIIECNNLGLRQAELKKEIKKIESGENMTDFLLDTCHIIKEFLELDEKEKTLYNHTENQENNQSQLDEKDEILSNIHLEKSRLSKRYSSVIDYTIAPIEQDYILHRCNECNITYSIIEGFMVCEGCGNCIDTIELPDQPAFKERQDYTYKTPFTYDKTSYMLTWLKSIQAKDNIDLPDELVQKVKTELAKLKISETRQVTYNTMRPILKRLKYNKYYQCIPRIIYTITDITPLQLTPEMEQQLLKCFKMIVETFENFKKDRKSLLSYSYIICKLFQMYDLHDYVQYLPMLKDNTKIRDHDNMFRNIINEIAPNDPHTPWSFTPTI